MKMNRIEWRKGIIKMVVIIVLLFIAQKDVWGVIQYTVIDLGSVEVHKINDNGQVVGEYSSNGNVDAFVWSSNSGREFLGWLGVNYGNAYDINNKGQVAGVFYSSLGPHAFRTALYKPFTDLGTLGGSMSVASSINNLGQVVGVSYTSDAKTHAFRTVANQSINPKTDDLGTLGGSSSDAHSINDSGQVVGNSTIDSYGHIHAYRTAANKSINPATDDLGTLGGSTSLAWDINNIGQVVGYSHISGDTETHAFRTAANQPINPATDDLGTLGGKGSIARGINNLGQVVGWSHTSSGAADAFLCNSSGPMLDLNNLIDPASGWTLNDADDINVLGQIVGDGYIGGEHHAFLLTPVPEPSTLILLGMAAFGLLTYAWRWQK
jgi:probable HAF family extracellular repeat protein